MISRVRADGPRHIARLPPPPIKDLSTPIQKIPCTCKCHNQCPSIPKDKCPGCFLVRVSSTLEPGELFYNVKRETLFKRLSDDYHCRMGLEKGKVIFYNGVQEVPWDSLDDFAKVFGISDKKTSKANKQDGNKKYPDYTLEAYIL